MLYFMTSCLLTVQIPKQHFIVYHNSIFLSTAILLLIPLSSFFFFFFRYDAKYFPHSNFFHIKSLFLPIQSLPNVFSTFFFARGCRRKFFKSRQMTLPTIPQNPSLDIRRHEIDNLVLANCFKHPFLVFVVFVNFLFFLFYVDFFVVFIYIYICQSTDKERLN